MKLAKLFRYIAAKTGTIVNLEALHPAFLGDNNLKLAPDQYLHSGAFCRQLKLNGKFSLCSKNKKRSLAIAEKGRIFYGTCLNGVWELACPVIHNETLAAVLYLGHCRDEHCDTKSAEYAQLIKNLPLIDMRKKKDLLKWAKFTAKFIKVELDLWELEHPSFFRRRPESSLLSQALAFIDQQYTKDISLGNLAHLLKVNPNYLSGVIHSGAGKTFRRLLNEKRVKEAEIYLKLHREMNVTEIAMLCGFNDSNYFSTVFKKITGISPVKFRLGAKCA